MDETKRKKNEQLGEKIIIYKGFIYFKTLQLSFVTITICSAINYFN